MGGEDGRQDVDEPVGHLARCFGCRRSRLKIGTKLGIRHQGVGIGYGQSILLHETLLAGVWQLGHFLLHLFHHGCCVHRHQIRAGVVAVVVGIFFGAHHNTLTQIIIPAARGLHLGYPHIQLLCLASNFVDKCAAGSRHGVDVFHLNLCSQFLLALGTQGHVHVAAHLPLFHVGVRDATAHENLLQALQIGIGLIWTGQIGGRHNLHQRCATAIVVYQGIGTVVGKLGGVFLQVDVVELHRAHHGTLGFHLAISGESP